MQTYDVGHYISRQTQGLSDPRVRSLFQSLFVRLSVEREPDSCFKYAAMSALCLKALGHDASIRVGTLECFYEGIDIPHVWCELEGHVYDLGIYGSVHYSDKNAASCRMSKLQEWELPVVNEAYDDIWFARYQASTLFNRWRVFETLEDMCLRDYFDKMPGPSGRKCWLQMLEALRLDCGLAIQEAGLKGLAAAMGFPRSSEIAVCERGRDRM